MSIQVIDANSTTQTINTLPNLGQAASTASLPVIEASDSPLVTGLGTTGDVTWTGSGSGSVVSVLKAIWSVIYSGVSGRPITMVDRSGRVSGAVAAASPVAKGTGVVPGSSITLPTGTGVTTPAVLSVATTGVVSATVANAGSGGTAGTQTVTGTTGTGTYFTASVTIISGAISAVNSISTPGSYTVNPTTLTAEPVTGGGLTGATLNIVMGAASLNVVTPGVYTQNQTGTITPASISTGTGITISLTSWNPLATQVVSSNTSRRALHVTNQDSTYTMGFSFGTASLSTSVIGTESWGPYSGYSWEGSAVPTNAINVIGQVAFQRFFAFEG